MLLLCLVTGDTVDTGDTGAGGDQVPGLRPGPDMNMEEPPPRISHE